MSVGLLTTLAERDRELRVIQPVHGGGPTFKDFLIVAQSGSGTFDLTAGTQLKTGCAGVGLTHTSNSDTERVGVTYNMEAADTKVLFDVIVVIDGGRYMKFTQQVVYQLDGQTKALNITQ